jgi:hypothetical protein
MVTRASPASTRYGSVRLLDVGLVLWPSFLAACAGSLLFFAAVDPVLLRDAGPAILAGLSRESGYALGFALFWFVGAIASALSVYLIRTARTPAQPPRPQPP